MSVRLRLGAGIEFVFLIDLLLIELYHEFLPQLGPIHQRDGTLLAEPSRCEGATGLLGLYKAHLFVGLRH